MNSLTRVIFAIACLLAPRGFGGGLGFSAGGQLHEFDQDFGVGLQVTTPYWFHQRMAFRLSGDMVFSKLDRWTPYGASRIGFLGGTAMHDFARFYGEGGVQVVFPDRDISENEFMLGGYGHFGFEFFLDGANHDNAYFIELGTTGIGESASKLPGDPIYFNGFCTGVGYRHYF